MMGLRALKQLRLVTEPVKRKRYRVFMAQEITDILDAAS
jgi:hypothetical protein